MDVRIYIVLYRDEPLRAFETRHKAEEFIITHTNEYAKREFFEIMSCTYECEMGVNNGK